MQTGRGCFFSMFLHWRGFLFSLKSRPWPLYLGSVQFCLSFALPYRAGTRWRSSGSRRNRLMIAWQEQEISDGKLMCHACGFQGMIQHYVVVVIGQSVEESVLVSFLEEGGLSGKVKAGKGAHS